MKFILIPNQFISQQQEKNVHIALRWASLLIRSNYVDIRGDSRFEFYLESRLTPIYDRSAAIVCSLSQLSPEQHTTNIKTCGVDLDCCFCNNRRNCNISKSEKQCTDSQYPNEERVPRLTTTRANSCDPKTIIDIIRNKPLLFIGTFHKLGVLTSLIAEELLYIKTQSQSKNPKDSDVNKYLDGFVSGKNCGDEY